MQTILGAGGAIGNDLAKELQSYTIRIRLVGRNPKKVNETDEIFAADLLDANAVSEAVKGSEVAYLVAGLPYKIKVWREQWPQIMHNVINACKQYKTKLVFFDNVYMYDPETIGNITEENPVAPSSNKGKIRAMIAKKILDEIKAGNLTAMIVRSADFYGPGIKTSVLIETVYKNLQKGKRGVWLGNPSKVHSFTYTPDAAKATALLGNTPNAYNQVWHLPTDQRRITGKEWIELFAKEMNRPSKYFRLTPGIVKLVGIFNPFIKELYEMMYQYNTDYFFNSSKFNERFPNFKTTRYEEGVQKIVRPVHPEMKPGS